MKVDDFIREHQFPLTGRDNGDQGIAVEDVRTLISELLPPGSVAVDAEAVKAGIEALECLKWNKVCWMRDNDRAMFGKVWDAELENTRKIEAYIKALSGGE